MVGGKGGVGEGGFVDLVGVGWLGGCLRFAFLGIFTRRSMLGLISLFIYAVGDKVSGVSVGD